MATGGLYGSTSTGTVAPQSGSESIGLYGNNTVFGGTYFEWFIFKESATQPATPTGGSWNFTTNVGTAPAGWLSFPPAVPSNRVWVSIGVVNSRSTATISWSTPGLFTFDGTVTSVAALTLGTSGFDVSSTVANPTTTPVITLNLPTASASKRGLLSSADWTAFNAKQPAGTYVTSVASADGSIVVTTTGTAVDLSVSTNSPASVLLEQVRNTTGATLTKGTAVYISGATGQIPTVSKALATSDATSAQTLGLITSDLPNNSNGYVTIIGLVTNLDTSAYTDGQQLYLSPTTAGTLTGTKPYAPQHLVYMAVVAHAHPTQGKLLVKVQNGYEMDELHNVSAQSPTNGQTLVYNATTNLWEKNTVSLDAGVNGTLPVASGGTGVASSTGTGSVVLDNSPTLVTPALGTPSSGVVTNLTGTASININGTVGATTPSTASVTTLTTSSTVTHNGGTANGVTYLNASKVLTSSTAMTFDGTTLKVRTFISSGVTPSQNARGLFLDSSGNGGLTIGTGASSVGSIFFADSGDNADGYIQYDQSGRTMRFGAVATEQMRLCNTGLLIGTTAPSASAILDAQSTTQGVRMPNMTTTQKNAISSPAAGLMVFDTTLEKLCVYSGTAWQTITSV